jgi:hypothetical protein
MFTRVRQYYMRAISFGICICWPNKLCVEDFRVNIPRCRYDIGGVAAASMFTPTGRWLPKVTLRLPT